MDANNIDPTRSDQSDDYMDVDSVPQFIPNPNDPQSHLANLIGALYLLMLVEEEERPRGVFKTVRITERYVLTIT